CAIMYSATSRMSPRFAGSVNTEMYCRIVFGSSFTKFTNEQSRFSSRSLRYCEHSISNFEWEKDRLDLEGDSKYLLITLINPLDAARCSGVFPGQPSPSESRQ